MKKFLISASLIAIFGFYVLYQKVGFSLGDNSHVVAPPPSIGNSGSTSAPSESTNPNAGSANSGSNPSSNSGSTGSGSVSQNSGQYKDGQYTGSIADAFYGNVQVEVTVQNGKISDVQFLQYPSDRSTSREINSQAMPYLKQEAIQAQSAKVDGVSGATQTSQAFMQSLASALAQAKI